MSARTQTWTGLVCGAVLVVAGLWLLSLDVFSDTDRDPVSGPAFCGSAYDVTVLEGDGYMGGEYAANQRRIDAECVRKAGRAVAAGSASGAAGLCVLVATLLGRTRARRPR